MAAEVGGRASVVLESQLDTRPDWRMDQIWRLQGHYRVVTAKTAHTQISLVIAVVRTRPPGLANY